MADKYVMAENLSENQTTKYEFEVYDSEAKALESWSLTVFWKAQRCNTTNITVSQHGSCLFQAEASL